jgi:hypothetical protein
MASDAVPLTTVLTAGGPGIHLAPGAPDSPQLTLCSRPVESRVSAQRFHRLGCPECVQHALDRGVTSIEDLQHANINLPRFMSAQGG